MRLMCRALQVAASGYYAWRKRTTPSQSMIADEILMGRIRIVFKESRQRYGSPRVHRELKEQGHHVGRKRVARLMRGTLDAELAVSSLRMAVEQRSPRPGLIHHSDRGSQYACDDFRAALKANGMRASMSRKADCWDNAVAESFFATLEMELIVNSHWRTRAEARAAIFEFIEGWYNRVRRHSTLGYLSPMQYEKKLKSVA